VVSTQGYMNFALLLARPLLPPTKLVVREVIGERYLEGSRFRTTYYRWYLRLVRRADRIVTQSDAAAGEMCARVRARPGQIIRLYNPIDTGDVARRGRTATEPFAGPGPHVVAAGRLSRQKGFDLLLEAFAQAVATGVTGSLTVLGEGPERALLTARAQALGLEAAVRFAGFRDNPYAYFAHADVFVLSSRYEGLPNVVLEALACGCPVIAFDCPHGVREIIRHDVNGLLVPPEDVGGLRDALIRLLGSAAERARLRSQITPTIAPFAAEEILRGWEALFDDVAPPAAVAQVA
jgi:glycosyltransferase involved in cell wall biosynthesis